MAKKSDPKDKPNKTFDVSKPGETPPSATSRPIIVNHSSMIKKDPMVRDSIDESEEKTEEDTKPPIQTHELKVEPLKEAEKEEKTEEAKSEDSEPKEEIATEAKEPEKNTEEPEAKPEPKSGAVEALAGEVTAKREEQKQREAAEAKAKELEKVIESKEFFVPVGEAARRRSAFRFVFAFLVLIILAAAILNFMIDAEIVDVGIEPLTDLL